MQPVNTRRGSLSSHPRARPITCAPEGPRGLKATHCRQNRGEKERPPKRHPTQLLQKQLLQTPCPSCCPTFRNKNIREEQEQKFSQTCKTSQSFTNCLKRRKMIVRKLPVAAVMSSHKLSGLRGRTCHLTVREVRIPKPVALG